MVDEHVPSAGGITPEGVGPRRRIFSQPILAGWSWSGSSSCIATAADPVRMIRQAVHMGCLPRIALLSQ
jgi:hypothetical protein